jgi:hypothetical protein
MKMGTTTVTENITTATGDQSGANAAGHTPGPWEYVPSTEHHGPYVEAPFGGTICDCYTMSNPSALSVRNGGDSKPVLFFHEMADPNARLIAAAPDMLAALKELTQRALDEDNYHYGPTRMTRRALAVIAKATGAQS